MRPRRFRAPGKLMLAGEHSVLTPGGEALALAIAPGVLVEAWPAPEWELVRAESGICWRPGEPVPQELRFAHAAWQEALEVTEARPHRLLCRSVDSAPAGASKPGVGGSASATVAVAAAIRALGGRSLEGAGRKALLEVALRAHRRAQHERGSGYDVATSALGGLLRWRPPDQASGLVWPEGLHLLAGFSGRSAPTAPLLARVADAAQGPDVDLRLLQLSVQALIDAFARADLPALLAGVGACQRALTAWDERRGLGLVTPELARLLGLAEELGAVCKISGAGGGDSVIALAESRAPLEQLERHWRSCGFVPFWPVLSPDGVRELP